MKIAIDARHFGPSATGIGRYISHLLSELKKLDSKNEYIILLQKEGFNSFEPSAPNFKKKLVDAPIYSVKEQLLVPRALWEEKPDLVHIPHFNVPVLYFGKFVVTVHDLIVSEFGGTKATTLPKPLYWIKRLGYKLALRKAIYASEKILVPSKHVKEKILKNFKVPGKKIAVTYEASELSLAGARSEREQQLDNAVSRFKLSKPFFLYVGNIYPHKNVSRLLDAIGKVKTSLVIVSPRNFFLERLAREVVRKGLGKYVRLLGFVPDIDLIDLYRGAEALVFPSLSEGFGLPAIEAMSLGCPAVLAKTSSLPEVAGDAALYFDPLNPDDIADKLKKILRNGALRKRLSKKGRARAKEFSWMKMARETFRVYEEFLVNGK